MKWMWKSVSFVKCAALSASVATMCLAPVAQGAAAENQKTLISQYLKQTGLTTKKMTVGEFWKTVRHVYPPLLQKQMDAWVSLNRNELMPRVEATAFKDRNGVEQVRLTLTKDNQSTTLTFTGDDDKPLKVNNVTLTAKDLLDHRKFNQLAAKLQKGDPVINKSLKTGKQKAVLSKPVMTAKEYRTLTTRQRAEYMVRMRSSLEAANKVFQITYGRKTVQQQPTNKYEFVLQYLFGDTVFAVSQGDPCVIAGYISKYGAGGSCGAVGARGSALNDDLRSQMNRGGATNCGAGVSCNPLVYGYSRQGASLCIPSSEVQRATAYCDDRAPNKTPEDKKRIIESYLKYAPTEGKEVNIRLQDGKVPEEQMKDIEPFMARLNEFIHQADEECFKREPLNGTIQVRQEQLEACQVLKTRMISLQSFAVSPEPAAPPAPLPVPPTETCNDRHAGSSRDSEGNCQCPVGQRPGEGGICVVVEAGGGTEGDLPGGKVQGPTAGAEECGFWCRNKNWMIPVGVGIIGLGLFWLLMKKGSKANSTTPTYVPPAPVPEPDGGGTTPVTPPVVEPPPVAPTCAAPNSIVNGVCTPPVIVEPPPIPTSEGGTRVDTPGRAGGVR